MTTYLIKAVEFSAAIVVGGDVVLQAAPALEHFIGCSFIKARSYCEQKGWSVQPVLEPLRPQWLEFNGKTYELKWNGDVITRIRLHQNGQAPRDLRFAELPEQLRKAI